MGYIFLLIALLAGATKGYCGKQTSNHVDDFSGAILANITRMLMCVFISFALLLFQSGTDVLKLGLPSFAAAFISGVSTSGFVILWLISVRKGAYMMLDVFCMIGMLIPIFASAALFKEEVRPIQWVGLLILFIAVVIMCSYNNSIKSKITLSSLILLILCGISNGLTDFSQKMFAKLSDGASVAVFNFYTYVFSAIVLIVSYFLIYLKNRKRNTSSLTDAVKSSIAPIIGYIVIMSVCLFINSYFKTLAASRLESAQLYPLNQGSALIISTLMSATLFHERLTVKAVAGVALSFTALIFINVI